MTSISYLPITQIQQVARQQKFCGVCVFLNILLYYCALCARWVKIGCHKVTTSIKVCDPGFPPLTVEWERTCAWGTGV